MVKGSKGKANPSPAKKKGAANRQLSPEQLYEQAQFALQYDDFDAARTALKKAAQLAPSNMVILDALGALLAEIGPEKEALQVCCLPTAQLQAGLLCT